MFLKSKRFPKTIRYFYGRPDVIYECSEWTMEQCKFVALERRDFFWSQYKGTSGNVFVWSIIHSRHFIANLCMSDVPGAGLQTLQCDDEKCIYSGPCHRYYTVLDLQSLNR